MKQYVTHSRYNWQVTAIGHFIMVSYRKCFFFKITDALVAVRVQEEALSVHFTVNP